MVTLMLLVQDSYFENFFIKTTPYEQCFLNFVVYQNALNKHRCLAFKVESSLGLHITEFPRGSLTQQSLRTTALVSDISPRNIWRHCCLSQLGEWSTVVQLASNG